MKYIIISLLAILVIIQFFRIDKSTPPTDPVKDFIGVEVPPAGVEKTLRTACYDCHSHETEYPWYAEIAPVSWWLADHIEEGREHLNYSVWSDYSIKRKKHKIEEMIHEVEDGEMPLSSYTLSHSDANLSDQQKEELITWLKKLNSSL